MHDPDYISLLLADANLPTGAFVASQGLESCIAHGALQTLTLAFVRDSLASYARAALPVAAEVHNVVTAFAKRATHPPLRAIAELDNFYHASTLNHVTRRASTAQGVALLTLYAKGFARPPAAVSESTPLESLVDELKLGVRKGVIHGHLPTCWAVLTAALGLPLDRCLYLHLFLHARGILSAAIRLNKVGPYAAQQLLLHDIQPLVQHEMAAARTQLAMLGDGPDHVANVLACEPASTWPLGELLAARHDTLHSRIFNS